MPGGAVVVAHSCTSGRPVTPLVAQPAKRRCGQRARELPAAARLRVARAHAQAFCDTATCCRQPAHGVHAAGGAPAGHGAGTAQGRNASAALSAHCSAVQPAAVKEHVSARRALTMSMTLKRVCHLAHAGGGVLCACALLTSRCACHTVCHTVCTPQAKGSTRHHAWVGDARRHGGPGIMGEGLGQLRRQRRRRHPVCTRAGFGTDAGHVNGRASTR